MERDKIIKALECCSVSSELRVCTTDCPYFSIPLEDIDNCNDVLARDALSLIKELIDENEYLKQQNEIYAVLNKKLEDACESYAWQYGTAVSKELFLKRERADTVRKIQERFKGGLYAYGDEIAVDDAGYLIDRIVEEILEENK